MSYNAIVFHKDGNRFLIRGLWWRDDDPDASPSTVMFDAMIYSVVCDLQREETPLRIEVDDNGIGQIDNRPAMLCGRQFAHGGIEVLVISGPLFEENAP